MTETDSVTPATPDEVLAFCNKVRELGHAALIDKLEPGVPKDLDSCLIARNLNFECRVQGYGAYWSMYSFQPVLMEIGKALGLETRPLPPIGQFGPQEATMYRMALPPEIRAAAIAFDRGKFPIEYYDVPSLFKETS